MKKIALALALALALLSVIALVACNDQTTPTADDQTPADTETSTTTATTIEGFTFTIPTEYTPLTKYPSTTEESLGWVMHEFTNPKTLSTPVPQSIYFYSRESIEKALTECELQGENPNDPYPCTHGLDLAEYDGQKQALAENKDYNKDTILENFNGRNYFVSNEKCNGDSCTFRTYSTYIDDTKIEIVIGMWGDETGDLTTDIAVADSILAKFSIE